jgi:hypothetical protein
VLVVTQLSISPFTKQDKSEEQSAVPPANIVTA